MQAHVLEAYKLAQTTKKIEMKFQYIVNAYRSVNKDLEEKQFARHSFSELEREVESWLTGVEVKMIELQPYTSDDDVDHQVQTLQQLNKEIRKKSLWMEDLNKLFKKASPTGIARRGIVEELNERYEQVLYLNTGYIFPFCPSMLFLASVADQFMYI